VSIATTCFFGQCLHRRFPVWSGGKQIASTRNSAPFRRGRDEVPRCIHPYPRLPYCLSDIFPCSAFGLGTNFGKMRSCGRRA
jgi:hypothetical protein